MKKQVIYLLVAGLFLVFGCAKEISFETGGSPSAGSLQDDATGDCLPKSVNGTFEAGKALIAASNSITVSVDVTTTGSYTIYTDTVNGYYFRGQGTFTHLGANVVTLRGNGTPFASGINNFVVTYGATSCDIQVTVLPSGAGGPATYTLKSTGGACAISNPTGTYVQNILLNGSNTITLDVDVTAIGTYNISTTAVNGITFAGNGAFLTLGNNTVILTASGTPTTAGANTINVTVGSSTCSFTVTVVGPAVLTFDCSSAQVNGTYQAGSSLNSTNTIDIDVNVTTAGAYSISTVATNGMVFSGSGTLSVGGPTTITLTGSNTPTAAGVTNIPVTFGSATCSVPVTVTAAPTIDWKFTEGANTYQGQTDPSFTSFNSTPPFTFLIYSGDNVGGDDLLFSMSDLSGGMNANETYNTNTTTANGGEFSFTSAGGTTYDADPTTTGVHITFKITSHNTATKTMIGTFSGTVKDGSGNTKTITNGQFSVIYP